jgi:hypothetical protein
MHTCMVRGCYNFIAAAKTKELSRDEGVNLLLKRLLKRKTHRRTGSFTLAAHFSHANDEMSSGSP